MRRLLSVRWVLGILEILVRNCQNMENEQFIERHIYFGHYTAQRQTLSYPFAASSLKAIIY